MQKRDKTESGFSLIELMMVAVIVALLATIAIPSLLKSRDAAEKAAAIGTMRALHSNQAGFYSHKGRYGTLSELNEYSGNKLGTNSGTTLLRANYTYYIFPSSASLLDSQYTILAVRFKDHRVISAFLMSEDGRIEILID